MNATNPPKAPLKEFHRWREACEDKTLEPEDYLAALVEATEFPDDAVVILISFLWPRFRESDGRVYLESRFSVDQAEEIPDEHTDRPDFWLNLTLISTWIRDPEVAAWVAKMLTQTWRSRLSESFPEYTFAIETLVDEDDVAVTFYRHLG